MTLYFIEWLKREMAGKVIAFLTFVCNCKKTKQAILQKQYFAFRIALTLPCMEFDFTIISLGSRHNGHYLNDTF